MIPKSINAPKNTHNDFNSIDIEIKQKQRINHFVFATNILNKLFFIYFKQFIFYHLLYANYNL